MMGFKSWISNYRVSKGERYSHLGMNHFTGSYYIPEEDVSTFHKKYYEHVFSQSGKCDLIESHKDLCCLLYDLDLTLPKDETNVRGRKTRGYTRESMLNFIQAAVGIASKYIDAPHHAFDAYVCEKDTPTVQKQKVKDGLHIMFPFIVTEPSIQHLIREELVIAAKHMFERATNDIEDIIDIAVLERNGWMMYGSYKKDAHPYNLTGIYQYLCDEDLGEIHPTRLETSEYYTPSLKLVELLSIRRFTMADVASIKEERKDTVECYKAEYNAQKAEQEGGTRRFTNDNKGASETNLKTVQQLVSILDVKRAKEYHSWMEVGWCLHNISEDLLDTWISFSERASEYANTGRIECEKRWNTMREHGVLIGVGSLHMWAKSDNLRGYIEIIQNDLEYFICKTVQASSFEKGTKGKRQLDNTSLVYGIATILKQQYGHYFVCSNYADRAWWEFTGNIWVKGDADIGLKKKLSDELYNNFMKVSKKYKYLADRKKGEPNCERYEMIAADTFNVASQLRAAKFRKQILDEASEQLYWDRDRSAVFESDKFEDILNTHKTLVALKNGVYNLETGTFRESRCEDYISLCADVEFKHYHWNDSIVQEILEFLKQILPEKEVRDYVMQVLANCLDGTIVFEHFHVWIGSGGNGKSKLIELFENAFGRYCAKLPIAALTGKRGSASTPQPEIARLRSKRFVVLQEPEGNAQIQVGIMKEYTGGDKITVRTLHKEPIEFFPQFTMFLTCNQLPKVPSEDGGTWRRLKVVKFGSRFVENPDPKCPNEFPIDHNLGKKLKEWAAPFFWLLTEYHKLYRQNGYFEPEAVRCATNEYKEMNDNFGDFLNEHIDKDDNSSIELCELFSIFQIWHKRTISDKPPSRKELQVYLEKRYILKSINGKKVFIGIKLKEQQDTDCTHMIFDDDSALVM